MDVRDLVAYNHAQRRAFAERFTELDWGILVENHETSHQNIANVFMHGANMEDWYLNTLWGGEEWAGPAFDGFSDAKSMLARVEEVEARTQRFLDGLSDEDLAERRTIPFGGGEIELSLEELLCEAVSEEMHHRGEVLAMLWRKDIKPPYTTFAEWAANRT